MGSAALRDPYAVCSRRFRLIRVTTGPAGKTTPPPIAAFAAQREKMRQKSQGKIRELIKQRWSKTDTVNKASPMLITVDITIHGGFTLW
jgi:hypothetical protein